MKTLVLQSYRSTAAPDWLDLCLNSVRRWAKLCDYHYQFMDDAFFEPLPPWLLAKTGTTKTLWSDYARVQWARHFLDQGFDRFVWIDADVLVFAPQTLSIDALQSYGLCHEVWLYRAEGPGTLKLEHRINNAVSIYCKGNPFLDFYRHAMEQIVGNNAMLGHDALGTAFFTRLAQVISLPVLFNVGLLNPLVLQAVARNDIDVIKAYMGGVRSPLSAANLCHSFRGQCVMGVQMTDSLFTDAIERCVESQGENLNRHRA